MMTAYEARRKLEAKKIELKACQIAFINQGIQEAVNELKNRATFDFEVLSDGAYRAVLNAGYKVKRSESGSGVVLSVSW